MVEKIFSNVKNLHPCTLRNYMAAYPDAPASPHVFYMLKSAIEFCSEFGFPCNTYQELKQVIETFRLMSVAYKLQEFEFVYPSDDIRTMYSAEFEKLLAAKHAPIPLPEPVAQQVAPIVVPDKGCGTCGGGVVR